MIVRVSCPARLTVGYDDRGTDAAADMEGAGEAQKTGLEQRHEIIGNLVADRFMECPDGTPGGDIQF